MFNDTLAQANWINNRLTPWDLRGVAASEFFMRYPRKFAAGGCTYSRHYNNISLLFFVERSHVEMLLNLAVGCVATDNPQKIAKIS